MRFRNPALRTKAAPPPGAELVGWRRTNFGASYEPRKLETMLGTYGGTEDSVVWVYACVSLIQSEIASYPYQILTPGERVLPRRSVPKDLAELLEEPNEDMTYFTFIEHKEMDEELAGNSYWLKDNRNGLGQPLDLWRLRPEFVQVAVSNNGRIIGYVYHLPGIATPIPYGREEIIHFRRPNPLSAYYGMGTVEAIQRALRADLAQTDHVIGFFSDGARISGVLTTNTLSEVQFQRFKEQFYEEYGGDANAHKILIAEQGTKFDPITQPPGGAGVVELRQMTKDEILAGFGVPSPLLGGVLNDANYKIGDSMHVFSRKMVPRARRTSERITRDLVGMWGLHFKVDVTYAEPRTVKIERAGEMLRGGASINESRREMDQPPYAEDWANVPVIPQGFAPFGFMTSGGAPSRTPVGEGGNVNGNQPSTPEADPVMRAIGDALRDGFRHFILDFRRAALDGLSVFEDDHNAARWSRRKGSTIPKADLTVDALFDRPAAAKMLTRLHEDAFRRMARIDVAGWRPGETWIRHLNTRGTAWRAHVVDQVSGSISVVVEEGKRRKYSMQQIAFGFQDEKYEGVIGVFDTLEHKVLAMVDDEAREAALQTTLEGYRRRGVKWVETEDGGVVALEDARRQLPPGNRLVPVDAEEDG